MTVLLTGRTEFLAFGMAVSSVAGMIWPVLDFGAVIG